MTTPSRKDATPEAVALAAERAVYELRRGREIEVSAAGQRSALAALECLDAARARELREAGGDYRLVLTAERASALGVSGASDSLSLQLPAATPLEALLALATSLDPPAVPGAATTPTSPAARAALSLLRQARLMPALLEHRTPPQRAGRLRLEAGDIDAYPGLRGGALRLTSRARVPLAGAEQCEFVLFRESFADLEHLALVIGQPDPARPARVRLHSACLTGDLLASLRCDCGDQLRGAVSQLAGDGGGYLLYLAQEGRGIGLANKLRAYALQDAGLDTLEADRWLGFRADERDYGVARSMLQALGVRQVVLMTNNPDKISALDGEALEVVGRQAMPAPVNRHNARYVAAKQRAGHWSAAPEEPG